MTDFACCTERLGIREFDDRDREALLDFVRTPGQLRYLVHRLETEQEVDAFLDLARATARAEVRTEWHLAVEDRRTPGCIGSVALMIDTTSPTMGELGYCFKRVAWGKGYATEASRLVLDWAFRTLQLRRIWGECHGENTASTRALEKLGMSYEGLKRGQHWVRGHVRTRRVYAILESEYRALGIPVSPWETYSADHTGTTQSTV
ncbi:MAG: GNAT family N-acetyltransferase [Anaerolineales bacterium]|nr:GNAT family N-acetyltransferase [Anaerolineales bacterium]